MDLLFFGTISTAQICKWQLLQMGTRKNFIS